MRRILSFVQQQCGGQWVGLSVIHLGETTVLFMILTQSSHPFFIFVVYRILVPSTTLLFLYYIVDRDVPNLSLNDTLNPTHVLFLSLPFHLIINYRGSRCTQCSGVY